MRWIAIALLIALLFVTAVLVRGGARPGAVAKAPPAQAPPTNANATGDRLKAPREAPPKAAPDGILGDADGPPPAEGATAEADAPARRKAPPAPPSPVVLFEHATHDASFPGRWWEVWSGTTNAGEAFANDQASAVDVPRGYQATLFADADEGGARIVLGEGRHNLAPYALNDSVSSVRVTRLGEDPGSPVGPRDRAVLWEHAAVELAERGEEWVLELVPPAATRLFVAPDDFGRRVVSAAWVPTGQELTLFHEPDGRGHALVLGPGYHELELVGFDDRALSARLRRSEEER
jgi:hypothetical protein